MNHVNVRDFIRQLEGFPPDAEVVLMLQDDQQFVERPGEHPAVREIHGFGLSDAGQVVIQAGAELILPEDDSV